MSDTPALAFRAVAGNITSRSLTRRFGRGYELVRAREGSAFVEHECEPGWPATYRLQPGERYEVQLFEVSDRLEAWQVPYDRRSSEEAIFYATVHDRPARADLANPRDKLPAHQVLWTDGLAVHCLEPTRLVEGALYKVHLKRVPLS